jgi:uncharacterized protein YgiM (DUF1202 family)
MDKIATVKNWLLSRVGNPYLMGGTGQPCTVDYRKARSAQYPEYAGKIKANCPRMQGTANTCKGCQYYDESTGTGKRAYDCAQLVRWAMNEIGIKMVSGATSQWRGTKWAVLGEMDTLPADKMVILFRKDDNGKMGHTGVALGDGSCVHAKGHDYGVVREGIAAYGRWTHWAIPEGLYSDLLDTSGDEETYEVTDTDVALRRGMSTATEVITRIKKGTLVDGRSIGGAWIAVTYKGNNGYMMAEFLRPINDPGKAEDEQEPTQEAPESSDEITLTLDRPVAEKLLEALRAGLERG